MEYIDKQTNEYLDINFFAECEKLLQYFYSELLEEKKGTNSYGMFKEMEIVKSLIKQGCTVELIETEYKDMPVDWVIALFS